MLACSGGIFNAVTAFCTVAPRGSGVALNRVLELKRSGSAELDTLGIAVTEIAVVSNTFFR